MNFVSLTFMLFLALTYAVYWGVRERKAQNLLLVCASYFFYGWWDYRFCALILFSSLIDFTVGISLNRAQSTFRRKFLLVVSLLGNLGTLAFFKYFGFFVDSFAEAAALFGWRIGHLELAIVLPVGISFYTFQTLSYTFDVYRRKLLPTKQVIDFLAYVSFFPQLVAGPIERGQRFLPQFLKPRVFDPVLATDGCRQILWGFFKKMVLADNIEIHGMPTISIHCLEVIQFLALETGNYTMLSGDERARVERIVQDSISILNDMPVHAEYLLAPHQHAADEAS